jgi:streptomycin 6-kinase
MHKWGIHQPKLFQNITYNSVYLARRVIDDSGVVLKLCRNPEEMMQEAQALEFYQGHGCVRLLDCDLENSALLLEHVSPGYSLKTLFPDEEHLDVICAANVMKKLHAKPLPKERGKSDFPHLETWIADLDHPRNDALPQRQLEKAKDLAKHLLETQTHVVLLHGDLHHDNILFDGSTHEWKAIDPKGVIGDPCYEVCAFMRNPIPDILNQENIKEIISGRIDFFSELLGFDRQRIQDWCYVSVMLSACWALEDGSIFKPEQWLDILYYLF